MVDVPNSVNATPALVSTDPVAQAPAVNGAVAEGAVAAPIAVSAPNPVVIDQSTTNISTPAPVVAEAPPAEIPADLSAALAAATQTPPTVNVTNNTAIVTPPAPETPAVEAQPAAAPEAPAIVNTGSIEEKLNQVLKVAMDVDARVSNIEKNVTNTAVANPTVNVTCAEPQSIVKNAAAVGTPGFGSVA